MLQTNEFNLNIEEMLNAGLHFGHKFTKLHPKMEPYLAGMKNTVHVIELEKTIEKLKDALFFIKQLSKEGKIILFVGTKPQHQETIKAIAKECSFPYMINRWVGGAFTNFETIKKRVEYLNELEAKKNSEEFKEYTKKERSDIEKEIKKLEMKFGGIKNMQNLPDAIFVIDMKKDKLAIKEARMKGIKIIAIADTNVDPTLVDYPIPANDDAISSVKYILEKVKDAILKSKNGDN